MLQSLTETLTGSMWTYAILFALAAGDAVLPILPSETGVLLGGLLAQRGKLQLEGVIAVAAAGAFVGDSTSYLLGRVLGRRAADRLFRGERATRRLEWATRMLRERGWYLIVVSRFIPGGRTAITFTAGLTRLSYPRRFLPFALLAAATWATYAALLGYLGGATFENDPKLGFLFAFGIALGVTAAVELYRRFVHRRSA